MGEPYCSCNFLENQNGDRQAEIGVHDHTCKRKKRDCYSLSPPNSTVRDKNGTLFTCTFRIVQVSSELLIYEAQAQGAGSV